MIPRIAVLGRGMLGTEVISAFEREGCEVRSFDLPDWDITRPGDIEKAAEDVDLIVNCAAYTNVDGAESERDLAFAINTHAVGLLGELCGEREIYLLHVSTDFVFDGSKADAYTEADPTNPLNVYGESKLAGEQNLMLSDCSHAILRVQWSYGRNGKNFVSKILELAKSRDAIKVVADQFGAPTPTAEMAAAILAICKKRTEGLFHYAAEGSASRFEVAQEIVRAAGISCEVTPCGSEEFPSPAARPANSVFDCSRFDQEIGLERNSWRPLLTKFVETLI